MSETVRMAAFEKFKMYTTPLNDIETQTPKGES